jgi:hypothetical protein
MRRLALVFIAFLSLAVFWRIVNTRAYQPDMGINLVVVGEDKVSVVGISKNKEGVVWVDLPSNLKVDGYPAVSIWGLGEIEGRSEELVVSSLGEGLGLWLGAALKVEGNASVDGLLKRLLSVRGIKGLSWLDRYTLYKDVSSLATKGVVLEMSLPNQVRDSVQDVDGYEWQELNEAVFVWSRELWPKEEIVNLGITAEVVNVSGDPGKARIRARQLESIGFRVVKVDTGSEEISKKCLVKINPEMVEKNEFLKQLLKIYLRCEVQMEDEMDDVFGDLVFLVG